MAKFINWIINFFRVTPRPSNNLGGREDSYDCRDFQYRGVVEPVRVPEVYFLPDAEPVKNQGPQPACGGFAGAEHKQDHEKVRLAPRALYARCKQIDGYNGPGTYPRAIGKALCQFGIPEEAYYPDAIHLSQAKYADWKQIPAQVVANEGTHKSKSFWYVGLDKYSEDIKQTVYQQQCGVILLIPWYDIYNKPDSNGYLPFPGPTAKRVDNHFVTVKGFTKHWLRCKNSFGEEYGDKGWFWLHREAPKLAAMITMDWPVDYPVDNWYNKKRTVAVWIRECNIIRNLWLSRKIGRYPSPREVIALAFHWPFEYVFNGKAGDAWLHNAYLDWLKIKNNNGR